MALGMAMKFYTSVAKGLNLKVRKFLYDNGLRHKRVKFVKVTKEKLVSGEEEVFCPLHPE